MYLCVCTTDNSAKSQTMSPCFCSSVRIWKLISGEWKAGETPPPSLYHRGRGINSSRHQFPSPLPPLSPAFRACPGDTGRGGETTPFPRCVCRAERGALLHLPVAARTVGRILMRAVYPRLQLQSNHIQNRSPVHIQTPQDLLPRSFTRLKRSFRVYSAQSLITLKSRDYQSRSLTVDSGARHKSAP